MNVQKDIDRTIFWNTNDQENKNLSNLYWEKSNQLTACETCKRYFNSSWYIPIELLISTRIANNITINKIMPYEDKDKDKKKGKKDWVLALLISLVIILVIFIDVILMLFIFMRNETFATNRVHVAPIKAAFTVH